jgi:hypothetical protein
MTTPNENVNVIVAIKDTLNQVGFACQGSRGEEQ